MSVNRSRQASTRGPARLLFCLKSQIRSTKSFRAWRPTGPEAETNPKLEYPMPQTDRELLVRLRPKEGCLRKGRGRLLGTGCDIRGRASSGGEMKAGDPIRNPILLCEVAMPLRYEAREQIRNPNIEYLKQSVASE